MSRLLAAYYAAKYRALAWLEGRAKCLVRWLNDAAWDAVEARAHYSGALDAHVAQLEAEIGRTKSRRHEAKDAR